MSRYGTLRNETYPNFINRFPTLQLFVFKRIRPICKKCMYVFRPLFSQSIYLRRGGVRVRVCVYVRAYTYVHTILCHQLTAVMCLFDYRDDVNQDWIVSCAPYMVHRKMISIHRNRRGRARARAVAAAPVLVPEPWESRDSERFKIMQDIFRHIHVIPSEYQTRYILYICIIVFYIFVFYIFGKLKFYKLKEICVSEKRFRRAHIQMWCKLAVYNDNDIRNYCSLESFVIAVRTLSYVIDYACNAILMSHWSIVDDSSSLKIEKIICIPATIRYIVDGM